MTDPAPHGEIPSQLQEVGSSRVLQGCLSGAVVLFVLLLGAMIVLAYLRFREFTGQDAPVTPVTWVQPEPIAGGSREHLG